MIKDIICLWLLQQHQPCSSHDVAMTLLGNVNADTSNPHYGTNHLIIRQHLGHGSHQVFQVSRYLERCFHIKYDSHTPAQAIVQYAIIKSLLNKISIFGILQMISSKPIVCNWEESKSRYEFTYGWGSQFRCKEKQLLRLLSFKSH